MTVDEDERKKTLALLWRLETGEGVVSESEDGSEDDEEDTHALLNKLSLADQQRFASLLREPERAARMYFDESHEPPVQLWWKDGGLRRPDTPFVDAVQTLAHVPVRTDLRYNTVAVLLAYTYLLCHMQIQACSDVVDGGVEKEAEGDGGSDGEPPPMEPAGAGAAPIAPPHPTHKEHQERDTGVALLRQWVPFLFAPPTSPAARTVLESVNEATMYFLHHLGADAMGTAPARMLLSLLDDLQPLLAQDSVHDADDPLRGTHRLAAAFADLHAWMGEEKAAAKKLVFYTHAYAMIPPAAHTALLASFDHEHRRLEKECDEQVHMDHVHAANQTLGRMEPHIQQMKPAAKIQVIE